MLHDSVVDGMSPAELAGTAAWRAGWVYFEAGFFWEAHEVLEPVWMQTAHGSAVRHLVQGLIQLANAALKARMARPRAVLRLCEMVDDHLEACRALGGAPEMGLPVERIAQANVALRAGIGPPNRATPDDEI